MYFISHLNQLKRSAMNENQTKHMSIKVFLFPPGPTISGIILGEDEKWSPIDWKTKKDEKCFDQLYVDLYWEETKKGVLIPERQPSPECDLGIPTNIGNMQQQLIRPHLFTQFSRLVLFQDPTTCSG